MYETSFLRLSTKAIGSSSHIERAVTRAIREIRAKGANVMTTLTQERATDEQTKQLSRVASDAAEKAVKDYFKGTTVSKEGVQRVHASADFAARIREATILVLADLSVSDKYKDEEVESKYGYLSGYTPGRKSLAEQCNALRSIFSGLGFANHDYIAAIEKGEVELPQHAEGWFAIPNWMKNPDIFGKTYSEAVQKVLDAIKQARGGKFYNWREGQINEARLRQSARSQKFWTDLAEAQGNPDILIIPAQFGIRHRGRSIRRALEVIVGTPGEFGLGAFAVGIMILTHPERLSHYDDLWIDCAGDEFDVPDSDVRFDYAPYFNFRDGEVVFGTRTVADADVGYGAASGFFPQS